MATLLPTGIPESKTYKASASLATYQYRIVKLAAAGQAALGTAGCKCLGVLQDNDAAAGYNASVVTRGETPVYCDGSTTAIAAGDRIMCAANGVGVKVPTTAATKSEFLGTAMEPLTAAGTIIVDVERGVQTTPAS